MTIISTKPQLIQFFSDTFLEKTARNEVLDFICRRGRFEFRVIQRWFAQEKRFCFWLTKLQKKSWLIGSFPKIKIHQRKEPRSITFSK
ncbi:hypothetical protein OO184_04260 [Photorhabdus sp. APURE]|nr:hypothetical protein [Photorhabdus aballayi]